MKPSPEFPVAVLLALVVSCDPAIAAPTSEPAEPVAGQGEIKPEPLQRGELRTGEPVPRMPDWPGTNETTVDPSDLSTELQRAIKAIPVPVLIPPIGPWRDALQLIPLAPWGYSLHARRGPSKLILQASGIAKLYPGLTGERGSQPIRGGLGHLTQNEGIRSASWIERGVAYTADLECSDAQVPECSSDGGYLRLLDSLVFVAAPDGGAR